jgi:hypothetical protein
MMLLTHRILKLLGFTATSILSIFYLNQYGILHASLVILVSLMWVRLGHQYTLISLTGFLTLCLLVAFNTVQIGINAWHIITMHCVLSIWDLQFLKKRISRSVDSEEREQMIRDHLSRLGFVVMIGIILSTLTMKLQLEISLTSILISGLILMLTLSRTISKIRREKP